MNADFELLASIDAKLTAIIVLLIVFLGVTSLSLLINFRRLALHRMRRFREEYYSDLLVSGEYEKALDEIESALLERPNDIQMMWYKAKALFQLERYKDARDLFYAIQIREPEWSESAQRYIERIDRRVDA